MVRLYLLLGAALGVLLFGPQTLAAPTTQPTCLMFGANNLANGGANFFVYCAFSRARFTIIPSTMMSTATVVSISMSVNAERRRLTAGQVIVEGESW